MLQQEEQTGSPGVIREYMDLYKAFSENLTSMLRLALTDPITLQVNNEVQCLFIMVPYLSVSVRR